MKYDFFYKTLMCLIYLQYIIYILYNIFFLILSIIVTNDFILCIHYAFQMYYTIIENIVDLCIYAQLFILFIMSNTQI